MGGGVELGCDPQKNWDMVHLETIYPIQPPNQQMHLAAKNSFQEIRKMCTDERKLIDCFLILIIEGDDLEQLLKLCDLKKKVYNLHQN